MENKDILDIYTPIGGDKIDAVPPYVGSRHYGLPIDINRIEEAAGSNPPASGR